MNFSYHNLEASDVVAVDPSILTIFIGAGNRQAVAERVALVQKRLAETNQLDERGAYFELPRQHEVERCCSCHKHKHKYTHIYIYTTFSLFIDNHCLPRDETVHAFDQCCLNSIWFLLDYCIW